MSQVLQFEALDRFAAWLDAPIETRDADLAHNLRHRPELLIEVERLIRAHAHAAMLSTEPPTPLDPAPPAPPPERVGPYRLIEAVGGGGMGVVFRAERDDGVFEQTVAVKLIRRGLFSRAAAEQFAHERQILARLRHPHIAQLFDGGVTPQGESYIVMELIEGLPIDAHCTERALDLRARVGVMRQVCDAVQFAHQQLIVHADIKPSNVVVDARQGVKLLDFGIAQLVGGAAPESGAPRAQTPAFASPQQAAGLAVTPADDVFSLGRMLAGLVGVDPPSQLAAVIARATATDPADRYGAAGSLSTDLARWLQGRPVGAVRANPRRAAGMFVLRHRLAVGASASGLVLLVAALAVSVTLYIGAEAARRQSEARFEEVRGLSKYLLGDVTDQLRRYPGTAQLRRDLALRGRGYLETLSRIPGAPLDVRLEVARGYTTTAGILGLPAMATLGDPRTAKLDLHRAELDLERLRTETHDRPDVRLGLAEALTTHAAIVQVTDNDAKQGEVLFQRACGLADGVAATPALASRAVLTHVRCTLGLASLYNNEGRFAQMPPLLARALDELGRFRDGGDTVDHALGLGNAYILRGDARYFLGDKSAALVDFKAAAAALGSTSPGSPDVRVLERLAWALYEIASTLDDMSRSAEALPVIARGVAVADLMASLDASPRARHVDAVLHMQRAVILASLHRFAPAIVEAEASVVAYRKAAALSSGDFEAARSIPVSLRPLGEIYWAAGRRGRACQIWAQTRAAWRDLARRQGVTGFDAAVELGVVARLARGCPRAT